MFENTSNVFQMECSNNPTVLTATTCDVLRLITYSLINGGYNTTPVCGGYLNMNSGTYDPVIGGPIQPCVGASLSIRNMQNGVISFVQYSATDSEYVLPNLPAGTYDLLFTQNFDNSYPPDGTPDLYYRTCPITLILRDTITDADFSVTVKGNQCTSREVCLQSLQNISKAQSLKYEISFSGEIRGFDCISFGNNGLCPNFNCNREVCFNYPNTANGWQNVTLTYFGEKCSLSRTYPVFLGNVQLTNNNQQISGCSGSTSSIAVTTIPSNLPAGTNIQWQPTTGLSNPNILNPIVTFGTLPVDYTLTVTLPNSCKTTTTVTATPFQCCQTQPASQQYFGSPNAPFDLATINPSLLVNKTNPIILNGHFTITAQNLSTNNSVIFKSCSNVLLAPGSTITVPNEKNLIIDNSHLKACDNSLWQGITLTDATSEIQVRNNSIIEQAEIAIRSQNGANLSIDQSTFDNNFVSVQIENGGDFYNGTVIKSKFLCTVNSLLPPRAGLKPTSGVQLFNTNGMTIGLSSNQPQDYNEFNNLNNGINAVNSSVTVYANKFTNIRTYDAPNQQQAHHGAEVFANTSSSFGCVLLPLFGCTQGTVLVRTTFPKPNSNTSPTFENCDRGIELWNVNAEVFYNPMRNIRDGVIYRRAVRKVAAIHNNYIGLAERGITASGNFVSTGTIRNNEIDLLQPPLVSPNLNWLTILFEANPPAQYLNSYGIQIGMNQDLFTSSYRVHNNTLRNGRYGIHLLNTGAKCLVFNNTIALTDNQANLGYYAGVYAENGNGSSVYQNQVTGNATEHIVPWINFLGARLFTTQVLSPHRKSGYLLNGSRNFLLSCNGANNIGYATHFIGNCETADDRVRENSHGNSQYGLVLERSLGNYGFIGRFVGTQIYVNNNRFNGSYSGTFQTYNWTTNDVNAPNFVPTFLYSTNQSQTPFPNGNSAGNQLLSVRNQPANTNNGFIHCYTSGSGGGGVGGGREAAALTLEEWIASGAVAFDEYNTVSRWKEEKYLFDKTDLALSKLLAQEEMSGEDSALIENTVVEEFYSEKKQTFLGKLKAVEDAGSKLNDETFENHPELVENLLDVLETKLGELPDNTEQHEQNLRLVYSWLNRWAREGDTAFTQQDWQAIGELAISCPFEAGTAVYEARTLLSMKQPGLYLDDQLICAQSQYFKKEVDWSSYDLYNHGKALPQSMVKLSYNNTSEELNVLYVLDKTSGATLEVYDMAGRKLLSDNLATERNSYTRNWRSQGGVYIYKIHSEQGFTSTGKFIVQ